MSQPAANLRVNYTPPPGFMPPGLIWLQGVGAPVDGAAGTGHGVASTGSRYTDTAAGVDYENTGTAALPVWSAGGGGGGAVPGAAATLYKLQAPGAPVDGVTGVGVVNNGELYRDTTNNVPYLNVGTLAVPAYHGFQLV